MKKRWIWKSAVCLAIAIVMMLPMVGTAFATAPTELQTVTLDENALYNGIVVPSNWNYTISPMQQTPIEAPYLKTKSQGGYAPDVINIDKGRQLFVDDFLIDSTTLTQSYYQAEIMDEPLFTESNKYTNTAVLTGGGVWYDMDEKIYKMWYQAGFCNQMAYATSTDGINWTFPPTRGGDGSNIVLKNVNRIAGSCVWLDYEAPAEERYKMMVRRQNSYFTEQGKDGDSAPAELYVSADGTRWLPAGETGGMQDRSTFFYNELTDKWVFSIRSNFQTKWHDQILSKWTRSRTYHEGNTWQEAATWDFYDSKSNNNPLFWQKADNNDPIDTTQGSNPPEIYNIDCIAYESVTLGLFQMWYGPGNEVIEKTGWPKITEIQAGYSRDGFYFERPVRGAGNALIPASRTEGDWDYGYLSTTAGGVIVLDDEIRIYYSGMSGQGLNSVGDKVQNAHVGGSIAYASLRRDGFASMDGTGELTTKNLTVTKDVKYLFVNANASAGSLKAEILDMNGNVVDGYSADDCVAFTDNSCCSKLTWNGADDLSFLQGKGFRIRFVQENAELFSFWLSADPNGASGGAMAAGYAGEKDLNPDLSQNNNDQTNQNNNNGNEEKKGCASTVGATAAVLMPVLAGASMIGRKRTAKAFSKRKERQQ